MKFLKFLIVLLIPISFSSCLEINEDVTVSNTGTGKYAMKIDMGQLFELMQSFMPAEELEKADLKRAKDTTISLKDFIDTSSSLSADKKALLRDGTIHLNMNMPEKVFKVDMQYPFTSLANFQKLYVNLGESSAGLGDMLKGMTGGGGASQEGQPQPNINKIASYFDLVTDKNSISRKLNKEKYAAMATDSMMQQLQGMSAMASGMELKMNMTLHLPSPVKKITGAKASVSDSKKTVTVQNNMLDIFEHPENFEFSVQY